MLVVVLNIPILDFFLPDIVLVEIEVHGCLQLTRVRTPAGKLALPPRRIELLVDGHQAPPAKRAALRIRFQVDSPRCQVKVWPVGAVTVEQNDFLEPVVGEALAHVQNHANKMLIVDVDRPWKIHDVRRVSVNDRRHDEHLVRHDPRGFMGHAYGTNHVHIQGKVRSVLLGRSDGHHHDFFRLHRLIDFRPGKLLITPRFTSGHGNLSKCSVFWLLSVFGIRARISAHPASGA